MNMAKKAPTNYAAKSENAPKVNLMEDVVSKESAPAATPKKTKKTKDDLSERFTVRFTQDEWEYLQEKHWQTRTSLTDIIRDLVKADMKKHPEFIVTIDELNK